MSDYEDDESVSSERDVGDDCANGVAEEEANGQEFGRDRCDEGLADSESDLEVGAESVSDKEEEKFEGILENSTDGSLVGDVERDDPGNEHEDFQEEVGHALLAPVYSGRARVAKEGSADISDGPNGSNFEEGAKLATNRQEAFSDDEQEDVGQKGLQVEVLEGDIGHKEDDDTKDVSEFEGDGKGSNDDYQVEEDFDDLDEGEDDLQIVYTKELPTKNARRFGGVRTNIQSVLRRPLARPIKQERFLEPESEQDEEEEEEEEDDEDPADDPQDSDFDPTDGASSRGGMHAAHAVKDSDAELSEEVSDESLNLSDDSLDLSDDSDNSYGKRRASRKRKTTRTSQANRNRTRVLRTQRLRVQGSLCSSDNESSAKDSVEEESDEDSSYGRPQRKTVTSSRRKRQETSGSAHALKNDRDLSAKEARTRTSSRALPRKSYVEAEDSQASEEERDKKRLKVAAEEIEEEEDYGDAIERVLWHQPKGIAEAEAEEGRHADPFVLDTDPNAELTWKNQEFYIKWKGQSYLHCSWMPLSELELLSGYKKVVNYMKKIDEDRQVRQTLSPEEAELHDVSKEMELDLLKQYLQVERVFADRNRVDNEEEITEYLVKWKGLSYCDSTWEKDTDIAFAQSQIDECKAREAETTFQGKPVDVQRRKGKVNMRKLEEQPEWLKGGTLRDYQLEGLNFLMNSWRNDTNVILADEMGLGKTVQSVSMLGFLQTCQQHEFYTGRKTGRTIKFNTLLTTYEVVLKDKAVLSKIKWCYLMVDEAHRLKNCEASLYTTLQEFSTKNKVLVTGTPLQNSVEELWALLHFLDSDKFKSKEHFTEHYKNLSSFDEKELANLHAELRPHLLRRIIKDVEKSLPPKIERILRVEMSPLQKQYYKWILERNFNDLNKGVRVNQVSLLNIVVELKKCCNHPFLFESADYGYGGDANTNDNNKIQRIVLSSGKLAILDKLLVRLKETKHRVLIFSQMVKMLDILADYLSLRGFQFQRLDGSTRADLRHQAMEHFNAPGSEDFCFLLSTRAGGLGINLATADTVIIFDSDWNPQNDLQAMSRAHRIGQRDVVNIYRFVISRSVEEDILERAKKKMVLDHLVIQKLNAQGRLEKKEAKKGTGFDKNELAAILRFGAEELFKDDKNEEDQKSKLENMDIDEILARAEKVETKSATEVDAEGNELLGAFKVANFSNTEDDATFWSRLIPPEAARQAEAFPVQDMSGPRVARTIRNYSEDLGSERNDKRRRGDGKEKLPKRGSRSSKEYVPPSEIEGAAARTAKWGGGVLTKKEANSFIKAVKKFGDLSRIKLIAKEAGDPVSETSTSLQSELWDALVNGCKDAVRRAGVDCKAAVLDFFGVPVKSQDMLGRINELTLLGRRIKRFKDPVAQFRLKSHPRVPSWSKVCDWSQVDDARLLLGVHYHGLGNWERIRLDERLLLVDKLAPQGATSADTSLPRSTHLEARVNALLRKELEVSGVINGNDEAERPLGGKGVYKRDWLDDSAKDRSAKLDIGLGRKGSGGSGSQKLNARDRAAKRLRAEQDVKEEGEISDTDEGGVQPSRGRGKNKDNMGRQSKEEKWHHWCAQMMEDQTRTLERLQRLQTDFSLPKEEVLRRVKTYLQTLGHKIDSILAENATAPNPDRMATRLWNYVSTFSNLKGDKLAEIYKKLRLEPQPGHARGISQDPNHGAAGPSGRDEHSHVTTDRKQNQVGNTVAEPSQGDSEPWKRRQKDDPSGGPPAASHNKSDRRKWEGRPGSADGCRSKASPPVGVVNGSGCSHDEDPREDRGPWEPHGRSRNWNRRDENRNPRPHPRPAGPYGHAPPAFTH
ncbi:protein CHROMATIN REMODELING 5 isoform X3 [Physcomitrium patens]|uniref:SNF2 family DNA-dependent ATPase n=1 Tax=Physcomitrium patens TaxID=3218 RepID=A0A7I4DWA2_PHYPA|nr:protein CHROMATIN REMODELING 5-like isoform X3 [Physcomitrium patens]|eukprot:XP_024377849.1 protein CHROMATIN REMODELING 5-like isoform X3 [Physcomitrella patens]